jgi:hypothetical protein
LLVLSAFFVFISAFYLYNRQVSLVDQYAVGLENYTPSDFLPSPTYIQDFNSNSLPTGWTKSGPSSCDIRTNGTYNTAPDNTPSSPDSNKSLVIYKPSGATGDCKVQHVFNSAVSDGKILFYFYDKVGNTGTNFNPIMTFKSADFSKTIGFGSAGNSSPNSANYTYFVNGQLKDSGIPKTAGWHKYAVIVENGTAYIKIDDVSLQSKGSVAMGAVSNFVTSLGYTDNQAMRIDSFMYKLDAFCNISSSFNPNTQCLAGNKAKITWNMSGITFTPKKVVARVNDLSTPWSAQYPNYWKETGDFLGTRSFTLDNIKPGQKYSYRVSMYSTTNTSGEGVCTTPLSGIEFTCGVAPTSKLNDIVFTSVPAVSEGFNLSQSVDILTTSRNAGITFDYCVQKPADKGTCTPANSGRYDHLRTSIATTDSSGSHTQFVYGDMDSFKIRARAVVREGSGDVVAQSDAAVSPVYTRNPNAGLPDCDGDYTAFTIKDLIRAVEYYFNGSTVSKSCNISDDKSVFDQRDLIDLINYYFEQ